MDYAKSPWKLVQNKITRYPGGRELDRFRGIKPALDDGKPEAWVGSVTSVKNAVEHGTPYEGRAECILPDGKRMYVFEAIAADLKGVLGEKHLRQSGESLGLLVKVLDAQTQLILQCHPTREYAQKWFGSPFGKTECWYVIGLRDDTEEPPYVLLGFKEGVTREVFEKYYESQDIKAMERCCHKIPAAVGDMYFVGAGVPHAVGPGCLLIEAQEPSDITLGVRKLPEGATREEQNAHRERQLGAYHYDGISYEENLRRLKTAPVCLRQGAWGKEELLLGNAQTPYFSVTHMQANAETALRGTGFVQIAIVLNGCASLCWRGGSMSLKKADELFIPSGVQDMNIIPEAGNFEAVFCHPQGAAHE